MEHWPFPQNQLPNPEQYTNMYLLSPHWLSRTHWSSLRSLHESLKRSYFHRLSQQKSTYASSTKFISLKYRDMSLPYLPVGESSYFLWYHTDKVLYHLNPTCILTSSQKGLIIEGLRFFKNKNFRCNLTKFCRAHMFSLLSSLQTSLCTGVSRPPPLVKPSGMFLERCLVLSCPQHLFTQGAAIWRASLIFRLSGTEFTLRSQTWLSLETFIFP